MEGLRTYEEILRESFIPPPEPRRQFAEPTRSIDWKPELKWVFQVRDEQGKQSVVGLERFKPPPQGATAGTTSSSTYQESRPQRHNKASHQDMPKDTPFGDFAILVQAIIVAGDEGDETVNLRLEIQSARLRRFLRECAGPSPELQLGGNLMTIDYPFKSLFLLLPALKERIKERGSSEKLKAELETLINFAEETPWVQDHLEKYKRLVMERNQITFSLLWMLFPPNEPALIATSAEERELGGVGCLVESIEPGGPKNGSDSWVLKILFGQHNGKEFQIRRKTQVVNGFYGRKSITLHDIPVVPLRLFKPSEREEIRCSRIWRGKGYVKYCEDDMNVMYYNGPVILHNSHSLGSSGPWDPTAGLRFMIDERVIVDKTTQNSIPGLSDEGGISSTVVARNLTEYFSSVRDEISSKEQDSSAKHSYHHRDIHCLRLQELGGFGFPSSLSCAAADQGDDENEEEVVGFKNDALLTDDDYFICPSTLTAFALEQRTWVAGVRVSGLRDVIWYSNPFDRIKLVDPTKKLLMKLVKSFNDNHISAFDDVIRGKGRGLNFLLHGPPGVGKTLTVEIVAEWSKRPLYRILGGELSTDARYLEQQLSTLFRQGARWNAVVLIDDADVLTTQRTVSDLGRNAVTAVFLRLLKYFPGLLFLTSNRIVDLDKAFHKMINVTLEYPELRPEWKTDIWREHVRRATMRSNIPMEKLWTDEILDTLGQTGANGYNMKNYLQTAQALAQAENEDLAPQHLFEALVNNTMSIAENEAQVKKQKEVLKKLEDLIWTARVSPPIIAKSLVDQETG